MRSGEKFTNKKVAFNTIVSILAKIINILIFIFVHQLLIKRIPVEEYSILAVVNSIMAILYISRFAVSGGILRFLGDAYYKSDLLVFMQRLSSYVVVIVFSSLLLLGFSLLLLKNIDILIIVPQEYIQTTRNIFILLVVSFIYNLLLTPFESGLFIKQRFVIMSTMELLNSIIKIIFIFTLFNLFEIKIIYYVIGNVLGDFIIFTLRMIISKRIMKECVFKVKYIRLEFIKEQLVFGGWLLLSRISVTIYRNMNPIVLNHFSTPYQVAIYYVGSLFRMQFEKLRPAFLRPFYPILSAYNALEEKHKSKKIILIFGKYYSWFYIFLAIPIILLRHNFIDIYVDTKFPEATMIILLLMLEPLTTLGANLLHTLGQIRMELRKVTIVISITQAINLVITIIFVAVFNYGALGAASARLISNLLIAPFFQIPLFLFLARITFREYIIETVIPWLVPMLLPVTVYYLWLYKIKIQGWSSFVGISVIIDFLFFVGCLLFMGSDEKLFLSKIVHMKLKKKL